jgi:glycosyltransferase involved in cell wall biosynthesis
LPTLIIVAPQARFFLSHRARIASAAREEGYRIVVACPAAPEVAELISLGFEFEELPVKRGSLNPIRELLSAGRLLDIFWRIKPDAAHLISAKAALQGGLVCALTRTPALIAVTGLGYIFSGNAFKVMVARTLLLHSYRLFLNRPVNHFVFQNETNRSVFERAGVTSRTQVSLIAGMGVDLAAIRASPLPQGPPVVMLPARMLRDKGVSEFIVAARCVRQKRPDVRFCLVGGIDSDNPTGLSEQELSAACGTDVEWHGHRSDISQALAEAHIVVLPSYHEGFPKVLVDAAAAGRPIVTSDIAGCRDAVLPNVTALLCQPRDIGSLADQLLRLVDDPILCRKMGAAGRKHAEASFDIHEVIAKHLAIYRHMCAA